MTVSRSFLRGAALLGLALSSCTPPPYPSLTSEGQPRTSPAAHSPPLLPRVPAYRLAPQDQIHIHVIKAENGPAATISPKEVLKLHFSIGTGPYHIMPGDELTIAFADDPSEKQALMVRPDGRITFPELGEVQASGHTPLALARVINALYEKKLNAPAATVTVNRANTKAIEAMNGEYQVRSDGQLSLPILGTFRAAGVGYDGLNARIKAQAKAHFLNDIDVQLSNPVLPERQSQAHINQQLAGYQGPQHVSSDGRIVLPSIGTILARGKTLTELNQLIARKATDYFGSAAHVSVALLRSEQRQFFISGQIRQPGQYPLTQNLTVAQAIAAAGGLNDQANPREIRLIHRTAEGKLLVYRTDLKAIRTGGHSRFDLPLSPQDVLYVPRSGVAEANLFVSQYINKMLPFSTGVNYTYSETPTRALSSP